MTNVDEKRNALLAMLPASALDRLRADLRLVELHAGQVLLDIEAERPIETLWFPIAGIVSLDKVIDDAATKDVSMACVALVGREGVIGVESLLGGQSPINRAVVRVDGAALKIDTATLALEFLRGTALARVLLGASDALLAQVSANSVCERLHTAEQRLVRWLLLVDDRAGRPDLLLTQEALAQFLGVRRETVSNAAGRLQREELIAYRRGTLLIRDRPGLERRSCACYRASKARYDALLEGVG